MSGKRMKAGSRAKPVLTAMAPLLPLGKWEDSISLRASIHIDYEEPGHEISPLIYGHFIEELGMCIQDGLWTPNGDNLDHFLGGIRPEVLEAARSINPSCIRWPGGCFADSYRWRDGIGPMGERRTLSNKVWGRLGKRIGPDVTNQFGTDEFLRFCEEMGAEPMITANVGTASPSEAGDWVDYSNAATDNRWGAERARNGRERPYGTRYWFVGNEMWNPFEPGWCTAQDYARRFLAHAREMRKRDPGLELIAVGLPQDSNEWNRTVLREAGEEVDYLSIHAYYPHFLFTFGPGKLLELYGYYWVLYGVSFFGKLLDRAGEAVQEYAPPGRDIKLTFDEWNLWYNFWDIIRTNYNLRDGLFCASMLNGLMRRADRIPIANIAQMINCIGIIFVDSRGVVITPSGWVFKMYTENVGDRFLETRTDCDRITCKKTDLPVLNVTASRDDQGEKLSLFVVNQHLGEEITSEIKLSGFTPGDEAQVHELYHADAFRYNTLSEPEAVVPKTRPLELAVDKGEKVNSFSYSFPPHSVSVISLKRG
jgi:alpha-N-arabinofuranosidase